MKDIQLKILAGSQRIRISIFGYSESSGNELSFDKLLKFQNFKILQLALWFARIVTRFPQSAEHFRFRFNW